VDVAQDVIISLDDCETLDGIYVTSIIEGGEIIEPLRDRIVGRVALENVKDPLTGEQIVDVNQEITETLAGDIQSAGIEKIKIRSVLTCKAKRGVCVKCYGRNLATGNLVNMGEAVGVIAAQSIGEPGTQLTMRTFHIGGTASRTHEASTEEAKNEGIVKFLNILHVTNRDQNLVVMNRNGTLIIADEAGREKERYSVAYGAILKIKEGQKIKPGQILVEWDPYSFAILTEFGGTVAFKDIIDGVTVKEERDENTGLVRQVITESAEEKYQPQILIKNEKGKVVKSYLLPSKAHLWVTDGEAVFPGSILSKIPRETRKTKDITGGLPRIVELFEARKPKETAVITEIDGFVKYGGLVRGQRKIEVNNQSDIVSGLIKEYLLPRGVHINVQEGEFVRAGEALMDGPRNPHDILRVLGEKELQSYLVNEIQEVYRLQGVNINDKHIEVIVRQMMRWIKVEEVGDTEFLLDEQVDKFRFYEENDRVESNGGQPAKGRPLLLGITKASLSTDSFISAASFQETTRVLTEAAISGKVDYLRGLKENVIMGRLIPAGTGMEYYRNIRLTEEIVPEEIVELEPDLENDLLSGGVNLDALKGKKVDLG
jgi:DNA-directed RNA polymerase subunit beta'